MNNALLLSLVVVFALFLYYYSIPLEDKTLRFPLKEKEVLDSPLYDYDQIGEGPLSLSSEIQTFPFPDLSKEVEVLSLSSRDDLSLYEMKLKVGLKNSEESLTVIPGQTLYLSYDQDHLTFSKEKTPLWVVPLVNGEKKPTLEMGVRLVSEEGEVLLDEKRRFQTKTLEKPKQVSQVIDPLLSEGAEKLSHGKWWAPDRFYEEYGGEEYLPLKGLERIKLEEEVLFVKEGDRFIWKEGGWQKEEETVGYPLAKVIEITPYKMEWTLWDESGLESAQLFFSRQRTSNLSLRVEDVFTRLRKRTTTRVSCRLDNRATIIKVGDWLVHTRGGWHTIKNYREVEALLNFEIDGELFIFDGIEKVDGKQIFTGSLFDSTRSEIKYVKLPMTQIKKKEHSPPTKKSVSSKIRSIISKRPVKNQRQVKEHD